MNAADARKKATTVITNDVNSDYAIVKEMIEAEVSKGKFECWVYTSIKAEVRAKLILEGFGIGKTETHMNETSTKITW